MLLLSVQWDKFQEHRPLLCSCSVFRGTNSKNTSQFCALAQRSVGQIPRRPITAVLLVSVQEDKFQEHRSLLCSCSVFSGTNFSKKTDHYCAPAKCSVGQIQRISATFVLLLSVQWDKFLQEDRSLLCSCSAFSWTNSKNTSHFCALAQSLVGQISSKKTDQYCALAQCSVGQIPRTPVTFVLLFSVQWDKFQEDRSLLCSCSVFSGTNSKNTGHCCAHAQCPGGQIPRTPVSFVLLLSVQLDKFQEDRSLLCFC